MSAPSITIIITTTTVCHYHQQSHHHLSLSSDDKFIFGIDDKTVKEKKVARIVFCRLVYSPRSVTIIITTTTTTVTIITTTNIFHYYHHNHHHEEKETALSERGAAHMLLNFSPKKVSFLTNDGVTGSYPSPQGCLVRPPKRG